MSDFRFEIERNPEPDDNAHLYLVRVIEIETGDELEAFWCEDPGEAIAAAREVQNIPLEERLRLYADRGW